MKKIINGRTYSTSTACFVEEWDNGLYPGDLYWYSECLYRKRNGEFFLHCEGGAGSSCAQPRGSNYCGGEMIGPLSLRDAQAWVEQHCSTAVFEARFGNTPE